MSDEDLEAKTRTEKRSEEMPMDFAPEGIFDASVPGEKQSTPQEIDESVENPLENSSLIDEEFWEFSVVVTFTDTTYLPNEYTLESDLHDLEVLAYAYENNDPYARASLTDEDALRVWGWIIKKRTGRFPNTFEFIDKKAKRLRRREMGPIADSIDCRVTPIDSSASAASSSSSSHSTKSKSASSSSQTTQSWSSSGKNRNSGRRQDPIEPKLQDAAQHIQAAAQIIGDAASEGLKEASQRLQGVAKDVQEAAKDIDLTETKQQLD